MEQEAESFYPPKPYLERAEEKEGHIAVTVFSIIAFSSVFLFFFDNQVILLLQLLSILLLHELGHYLFMKLYGYKSVRMLFIPLMGAFVHGHKEQYQQKQSIIVILAGPIPGIIIGSVLWYFGMQTQTSWMLELAFFSFLLNVSNLLPILPLDGGRLVSALFFEKAEIVQLIFAFISSVLIILIGFYLDSYLMIAFGFIMGIQVRSKHRRYLVHKTLKAEAVEYQTTYEQLSDRAYHIMKRVILEHTPGLRKFLESNDGDEDSTNLVAGEVNNMLVPPQVADASVLFKVIVVCIWVLAFVGPIALLVFSKINQFFDGF